MATQTNAPGSTLINPSGKFSIAGINGAATTSGYWVSIACVGGIMLSNTPVAPIALGILLVALIVQTNLLLQGK